MITYGTPTEEFPNLEKETQQNEARFNNTNNQNNHHHPCQNVLYDNPRNITTEDLFILFQELLRSKTTNSTPGFRMDPPIFNGRSNESLSLWLFQMNQLFIARKIPDYERLMYVSSSLGEAALAWLHNITLSIEAGNHTQFNSWLDFESAIRRAFEPPRHQQLLRTQLRNIKQNNSTAQEYTFKFRTILGQIANMNEEDKICYFIAGLNNRLRTEVEMREPNSIEEAMSIAVKYDNSRNGSHLVSSQRNWTSVEANINQRPLHQQTTMTVPMELGSVTSHQNKKQYKRDPDYFKKHCSKCTRFGHTDEECRKHPTPNYTNKNFQNQSKNQGKINILKNNHEQEANIITLPENDKTVIEYLNLQNGRKNDLLILDGFINGQKAKLLLDSGASYDYVAKSFIERNKLETEVAQPRNVTIADGTNYVTNELLPKAELRIGKFNDQITFHCFPLTSCDIILGKPFLFRHNPRIDWRTNVVEIDSNGSTMILKPSKNEPCVRTAFEYPHHDNNHNDPTIVLNANDIKELEAVLVVNVEECSGTEEPETNHQLSKLLSNYENVFKEELNDLPPERSVDHHIELQKDSKPICLPPYRMSPRELDTLRTQLNSMLEKGFIKPSKSPWGFPVLFAKKKDGTLRLCVDYRALNKITNKNSLTPPRIDELFDRLANMTCFSRLDLSSGYHQIRIAPQDTEKTAFRTRYGNFEYTVMPFGLCNAPATFQTLMNSIFEDMVDSSVIVYLDDILVFSTNPTEHLAHLERVLEKLSKNSLFAKRSKCEFFKESISFLGHIVSSKGIAADPDKTKTIANWPAPKNITELQQFLGLSGYYRKFVPNFAGITSCLTDLLKKDTPFVWTPVEESSFALLKRLLISPPILILPDLNEPFIISTDASLIAVSAVLSQRKSDGIHPICYESKKLNEAEKNYPIHELECYAIIHAFKKWKCYLEGSRVTIQTDHKSLQYLQTQKQLSRRMSRWSQFLQQFDFEITYVKGKENLVPDILSRIPTQHNLTLNLISETDWPEYLIEVITTGNIPEELDEGTKKKLANEKENFVVENDILYRVENGNKIPFVPLAYRADLVEKFHNSNGHLALESTYLLFKVRYWWPLLKKDLKAWISKCPQCQLVSSANRFNQEELHPLPVGFIRPFSRWSIDFVGPLPRTERGNQWLLVAVDHCTKWPIAQAVPNATANCVSNFIENLIITQFGLPDEVLTDRGPAFNASTLEMLLDNFRIKHLMTSSYHPRTNGVVERYNGVIGKMITKYSYQNRASWDLYVNTCLLASRARIHNSTGFSPFYLVYGSNVKLPGDETIPNVIKDIDNLVDNTGVRIDEINSLLKNRQEAKANLNLQRNTMKINFDKKLKKTVQLQIGDIVLVRNEAKRKLEAQWFGPFVIIAKFNHGLFKVATLSGKPWPQRIHRDRLKPAKHSNEMETAAILPKFTKKETKKFYQIESKCRGVQSLGECYA